MAPITATVNMSFSPGGSDRARARELYKYNNEYGIVCIVSDVAYRYYRPHLLGQGGASALDTPPSSQNSVPNAPKNVNTANLSTSKISSPDTALTAFSQLVAWRLETQRAMIRFVLPRRFYICPS